MRRTGLIPRGFAPKQGPVPIESECPGVHTLFELENPYPILPAEDANPPVLLNISNFAVNIDDEEIILTADI
jgi:hypothetical protein